MGPYGHRLCGLALSRPSFLLTEPMHRKPQHKIAVVTGRGRGRGPRRCCCLRARGLRRRAAFTRTRTARACRRTITGRLQYARARGAHRRGRARHSLRRATSAAHAPDWLVHGARHHCRSDRAGVARPLSRTRRVSRAIDGATHARPTRARTCTRPCRRAKSAHMAASSRKRATAARRSSPSGMFTR